MAGNRVSDRRFSTPLSRNYAIGHKLSIRGRWHLFQQNEGRAKENHFIFRWSDSFFNSRALSPNSAFAI